MKKLFVFGFLVIFMCGCAGGEDVNCTVDGQDAVITLKDGIITSYTLGDSKKSQSELAEINGEYFTSATNNDEGREALNIYMSSVNGSCE